MPETDTIPVSASGASVGKGIRYVGNHAYAISGAIEASQTAQTILEFDTKNAYIIGKFTCNPVTNFTAVDGAETTFQLSMNGQVVGIAMFHNNASDTGGNYWIVKILLPPHTSVKLEMDAATNTATYLGSAIFTGRVYGAE
jgi:hypothetical protein